MLFQSHRNRFGKQKIGYSDFMKSSLILTAPFKLAPLVSHIFSTSINECAQKKIHIQIYILHLKSSYTQVCLPVFPT